MSNALPLGGGANPSPGSYDYFPLNSLESKQEVINTKIPQGSGPQGAILSKHTDDIPLEAKMGGLRNDSSAASHPVLKNALFQIGQFSEPGTPLNIQSEYMELKNLLKPDVKAKIDENQSQPFDDQDPDLVGANEFLKFGAQLLTIAKQLKSSGTSSTTEEMQRFEELQQTLQNQLLTYTDRVMDQIEHLLQSKTNSPNYDILLNAKNVLERCVRFLKQIP